MATICKLKNKKILIIGGTQMIGRDFVELCIENTIYPTLANRDVTNNHLFPDLYKVKIDRSDPNKCSNLKSEKTYDLVIDFSCYNINQFLNTYDNIKYVSYIMISTLCVFDENILKDNKSWLHDSCKNKKLLEEYLINKKLNNMSIVRPCVLYGKYDYTNRFYEKDNIIYWKHSNEIVKENLYHIPVRKFSENLLIYILSDTKNKNIHINSLGIEYI